MISHKWSSENLIGVHTGAEFSWGHYWIAYRSGVSQRQLCLYKTFPSMVVIHKRGIRGASYTTSRQLDPGITSFPEIVTACVILGKGPGESSKSNYQELPEVCEFYLYSKLGSSVSSKLRCLSKRIY